MSGIILSIVSITKNDHCGIDATLKSILELDIRVRDIVEVIIVNGGDDISEITNKYFSSKLLPLKLVNTKDRSLYHAMNIGISNANGSLLWMLNGGDICWDYARSANFYDDLLELSTGKSIKVFQTASFDGYPSLSNWERNRFVHQGVIYSKSIHETHGNYIEWKKFTAADFLFFLIAFNDKNIICNNSPMTISKIGVPGLSSRLTHYIVRDISFALEKDRNFMYLIYKMVITAFLFYIKKIMSISLSKEVLHHLRGAK